MFLARYLNRFNFLFIFLILLTSCQKNSNISYFDNLLEDPVFLEKEVIRCEKISDKKLDNKPDDQCDLVKEVSTNILMLSYEMTEDPQGFGDKILRAQMDGDEKKAKLSLAVIRRVRIE
jgi:hypothetical protein